MQMHARTPAMTAMTAMTLDGLSGGRFIIGLGPSNPQVVEGWHGVPYGKPLQRYREYIAILRKILAREEPLRIRRQASTRSRIAAPARPGLGKPLKSDPARPRATWKSTWRRSAPKGMELAAEIADGVIPVWMSPERWDLYQPHLEPASRRPAGEARSKKFDLAPYVTCVMGHDIAKCREPVKQSLALYIGGMGARDKNFYNNYVREFGYEERRGKSRTCTSPARSDEAVAAVPDKLVDAVALVGPRERIAERVADWKASPVRTMIIGTRQIEARGCSRAVPVPRLMLL